jgi:hypothetical protein
MRRNCSVAAQRRDCGLADVPRGWEAVRTAQYPLGQFSPYGDEMLPLLQSVVEHGGVDPNALTQVRGKTIKRRTVKSRRGLGEVGVDSPGYNSSSAWLRRQAQRSGGDPSEPHATNGARCGGGWLAIGLVRGVQSVPRPTEPGVQRFCGQRGRGQNIPARGREKRSGALHGEGTCVITLWVSHSLTHGRGYLLAYSITSIKPGGRFSPVVGFYAASHAAGVSERCGLGGWATTTQAPVVVAAYAGTPLLEQKMEEAVRVHQDDATAVEFGVAAARVLERVRKRRQAEDDVG